MGRETKWDKTKTFLLGTFMPHSIFYILYSIFYILYPISYILYPNILYSFDSSCDALQCTEPCDGWRVSRMLEEWRRRVLNGVLNGVIGVQRSMRHDWNLIAGRATEFNFFSRRFLAPMRTAPHAHIWNDFLKVVPCQPPRRANPPRALTLLSQTQRAASMRA